MYKERLYLRRRRLDLLGRLLVWHEHAVGADLHMIRDACVENAGVLYFVKYDRIVVFRHFVRLPCQKGIQGGFGALLGLLLAERDRLACVLAVDDGRFDQGRFDDPKQLQKLAGYAVVKNESGKHKGESHISYRGRKRLRYVLYEAAVSMVAHNPEFRQIHEYYTTRDKNPLKKMQSLIAVACKLIRIFYLILQTGATYDAAMMMGDIRRPEAA